MDEINFIIESNRIEGIFRDPSKEEISEFFRFMELSKITIPDMEKFVSVYQPGAVIRDRVGLNVRVGRHIPPSGGPEIITAFADIINRANLKYDRPYETHIKYETLHPFTDGNGRSGRMLWAWQFRDFRLGFLHRFYYQTFDAIR